MNYVVAAGHDREALAEAVNKLIDRGYKPVGGISERRSDGRMYQAMVKRDPEPPESSEINLREPAR